jgi:hypothetical protein
VTGKRGVSLDVREVRLFLFLAKCAGVRLRVLGLLIVAKGDN